MIVAVIPAKSDSRRFPGKNMAILDGHPLVFYTIKAAKEAKLIDEVFISTDSEKIAEFAKSQGASVIMRDKNLCGSTPVIEVYRHALSCINSSDITHIVGLQPDHPDRQISLDATIRFALDKDFDDLISVDSQGEKNGSIRIMKRQALRERELIGSVGTIMDNATNIHTHEDFLPAGLRIKMKKVPSSIRIEDKIISKDNSTFIIAEGACNHMCDINLAKRMIDEAKSAGVDAIKFQTYKADRLVLEEARSYWNYPSAQSQYEYYKNLDKFEETDYKVLFDYAKEKGIIAFSTPFDIQSASMLNGLDMPLFKIASCCVDHKRLLKTVASFGKPIILSLGGAELEEIEEAIETVFSEKNYSLILLACTLSYPTKNQDAHLLRIRRLQEIFQNLIVGLSDHTWPDENMAIPALAVSLGAKVIEKHFTLDRTMSGSGHSFSVDPPLLKKMVCNIRLAEEVLGRPDLGLLEAEKKTRENARMSIVVRRKIKKGQRITEDMLTAKRPGCGISAKFIDEVIGKVAKRELRSDELLSWSDIE